MSKKFIIAGGGTGGHIFPAVAIANAIKHQMPDAEFLFIGAKGKMEMEKVPQAGYAIQGLTIAGLNRGSILKNILLPYKLVKSFLEVRNIFKSFPPNAVIGVGGYSSYPVLKFAQQNSIPTFIHESNAYAGKSNKMLGRNATKIFVATKGMESFFPKNKIIVSGNPVRKSISENIVPKENARLFFGLQPNKITVLSIGGSLGAQSINEAVATGFSLVGQAGYQIIWQTGKPFFEEAKQLTKASEHVFVTDFIKEMEMAYSAADVVISRAGAMSVAELAIVAKPTVFVPYPFAAEDHQTHNAMALVNTDAAWIVKDKEASKNLISKVMQLAKDETIQKKMKENMAKHAVRNADELIAITILKQIG